MTYVLVENGVVTHKRPNQARSYIEAPDHVVPGFIQNADGSFSAPEPPKPTVAQLKDYVNEVRAEKEKGPFTIDGYQVDTDQASQSKITGKVVAIQAGMVSGDVSWRMADDVTHQIAQADFLALAGAVSSKVEAVYAFSWQLKANIDAGNITTFDAIETADWPA